MTITLSIYSALSFMIIAIGFILVNFGVIKGAASGWIRDGSIAFIAGALAIAFGIGIGIGGIIQ